MTVRPASFSPARFRLPPFARGASLRRPSSDPSLESRRSALARADVTFDVKVESGKAGKAAEDAAGAAVRKELKAAVMKKLKQLDGERRRSESPSLG